MNQEEYEKLLFKSRAYNTSKRCYEIEDVLTEFLIKFMKNICQVSSIYTVNVFKSADVLTKRDASLDHIGYRWFSEPMYVSTNMCIYVKIHKDIIKKVL